MAQKKKKREKTMEENVDTSSENNWIIKSGRNFASHKIIEGGLGLFGPALKRLGKDVRVTLKYL